jgi:hypothetical protein
VVVAVMGNRDVLFVGCNVVASMSMMPIHAAQLVSGGGERRRSSAAEIRSMTLIFAPHFGQRQELKREPRDADGS